MDQYELFIASCSHHVSLHYAYSRYTKVVRFSKIFYRTSLYDPVENGVSANPNP
jgi:hypothetical protein